MSEVIHDAEIESKQMVPVEQTRALAKPVHRPLLTKEAIKAETEQRKLLGEFIDANMVEGIEGDYGVIPGTRRRTLLKPGAEKLIQLFYCTPRYTVTSRVEDYDTGLFSYHFKCEILNSEGYCVAEGVGFASTYESKFRWTSTDRVCPACGKPAIIKGKEDYGGGWLCYTKKGGCNHKYADDDKRITSQDTEQKQNPDIVDKINTVFKIAKKRAVVDAAISLARCSDLFTQDLEDNMSPEANGMATGARNTTQQRREAKQEASRGEQVQNSGQQQPQQAQQQGNYEKKKCPECGAMAVGRSQYPPRGNPDAPKGWFCYPKSGGCNKPFDFDHPAFAENKKATPPQEENSSQSEINTAIEQWKNWGDRKPTNDDFNRVCTSSADELKTMPKNYRIAIWNCIKDMAAARGWKWNDKSKTFDE